MLLSACTGVGGRVPGAPAHHRLHGFENPDRVARPSAWRRWTFFVSRVWSTTFAPRRVDVPRVANDGRALRDNHEAATITWVGHASFLVQLDGVNVLTDPQWSQRASPVTFGGPGRLTPPGLRFEDLPPIDVVVISHDHYDHLDVATVRRLAAERRPRFLVPLGLKAWFAREGITDVEELDWWQSADVRGVRFTCVPAQHFSGRSLWTHNRTLWSGWTIAGRDRRAFFGGDSAYNQRMFADIGTRLGPFDVAAIAIGAYLPPAIMHGVHTTPEEALQASIDLHARRLVAMHWGTFDLAEEPPDDPPRRLLAEVARRGFDAERVWLLAAGETRSW